MKSGSSARNSAVVAGRWRPIYVLAMLLAALAPVRATTIYDNSVNDLDFRFDPGTLEVADEIILAGSARYLTNFDFQFWGVNTANPSTFAGPVEVRVRFYQNDGPLYQGYPAPGTAFFDSGWFSVGVPTPRSTFVFTAGSDFPVGGLLLPSSDITWSVQFRGMGATDSVGIDLYSPPVIGLGYPDFWQDNGGWVLLTNAVPMDFAARFDATSGSASLPTITTQPQHQTVMVGDNATFNVSATGSSPLGYRWRFNGTNLTDNAHFNGSATANLIVSNVQPADAGSYSVVVTNVAGSATSTAAVLTVNCPAITLSPSTLPDGTAGSAFSQTLTAAGGASPYAFAVTAGGLPAGLTLSSSGSLNGTPSASVVTNFTVTATDTNGCVGSQGYILTINPAPLSGLAIISSVTGPSQSVPASCPAYCELTGNWSGSTLKSSAAGLDPTRGGSRFSTTTDAAFAVIPTLPDSHGTYYVEVTHGSASSLAADLIVSISVTGGTGLPATTDAFQRTKGTNVWQRIGALVLDGTTSTPTLTFAFFSSTAVSPNNRFYADGIRFVSTNMVCLAGPSQLTTVNGPLAAGQTFVNVPAVDGAVTNVTVYAYDGTNYAVLGQRTSGIAAGDNTVTTTPLAKGQVIVASQWKDGFESCLSTTGPMVGGGASPRIRLSLNVHDSLPSNHTIGADGGTAGGNHYVFVKATNTVAGGWGVAPLGGEVLQPGVCWQTVTFNGMTDRLHAWWEPGDYFNSTWAVLDSLAFAIDDLTDTGPYAICLDNLRNGSTVIQDFESATNGEVAVMMARPSYDSTSSAYLLAPAPGTRFPNMSVVVNTNAASGSQSLLLSWQFKDNAAQDWMRAMFRGSGTPNPIVDLTQPISIDVLVYPVNPLPAITSAPTNCTVGLGGTAEFAVQADAHLVGGSGGCTASYQWRLNGTNLTDNGRISGSHTARLTITDIQPADAGSYSVVVGNAAGSATSSSASLTIVYPPVFTGIAVSGGACTLAWTSVTGLVYQVEASYDRINWSALTTAPAVGGSNTMFLTDPVVSALRYYRLRVLDYWLYSLNEVGYINVIAQAGSNWVFNPFSGVTLDSAMPPQWNYPPPFTEAWLPNGTGAYDAYYFDNMDVAWYSMSYNPAGFTNIPANKYFVLWPPTQFTFTLAGEVSGDPTNQPTLIYAQPGSVIRLVGDQATFTVGAAGSPQTYQWFKGATALADGGKISGATTPNLAIANLSTTDAGFYSVVISNSFYGTSQASASAELSVVSPPVSRNMTVGGRVTFVAPAAGTGPCSYQWSHNSTPISSASSLVLTNLQLADAGTYWVTVSSPAGSVSADATLNVSPGNALLYPTNLVVLRVGEGSQTLSTGGNSGFLDQYTTSGTYLNTVSIPDSGPSAVVLSGSSYVEGYLTRSLDGRLLCLAAYGTNLGSGVTVTTTNAVTVPRVVVTYNGQSLFNRAVVSTNDFSGVSFRSAATDGTNNFWGAGAAGGIVYLGNNSPRRIVETNKLNCRAVEIFNGNLCMASASTLGDDYTGIYQFNGLPQNNVGLPVPLIFTNNFNTNTLAGLGDFAINPAQTILYFADERTLNGVEGGVQRWDFDSSNGIWVNSYHLTNGLGGLGTSHLAVDWGGPNPVLYATTATTSQNQLVSVTDTGPASVFTILATTGAKQIFRGVKFGPSSDPPVILAQPQSRTNNVGTSATFSVMATGTPPLNYQWRFNGVAIPGATDSSFTLLALMQNAGSYSVVVSNGFGSQASSVAVLTVPCPAITLSPAALPGATDGTAYSQTLSASGGAAPYTFTVTAGILPGGLSLSTNGLLSGTPSAAGTNTFSVSATDTNGCAGSQAYTLGVAGTPPSIVSTVLPNSTNVPGATASFGAYMSGTLPLTYQWRFSDVNWQDTVYLTNSSRISGAQSNILTIADLRGSDTGNYTLVVTNAFGGNVIIFPFSVTCPTITLHPATLPDGALGAFYTQTLYGSGGPAPYFFTNIAGTLPPGLSLSSSGVLSGTPSAGGTNTFTVAATDTRGCTGSQAYTVVVTGLPPSITAQPQSQTVAQGTTAYFSVAASGTTPLSYQWKRNGANLMNQSGWSGVTTSTLAVSNVQPAHGGSYSVLVTNSYGSMLSSSATLIVATPPAITVQPQSVTAVAGTNVGFSVTASGTAPLSYQWSLDEVAIPGATGSSYTRLNVQSNDAGNFSVLVTNVAGIANSSNALLTVLYPPAIVAQPQSQTVGLGQSASFAATATGSLPLSYQWRFNGTPIPGATGSGYTRPNVQISDTGSYSLLVTNSVGALASSTAMLAVTNLTLNAIYNAATDVPLTISGFSATGNRVNFTLNYTPTTGTELVVIKNTGLGFINGTFDNLAQGQVVGLSYNGAAYNFVANYFGGSGNDLVLTWADSRAFAWGYNFSGELGDNTTTNRLSPVPVTATGLLAGKTVVQVAAGYAHSLALCSDGTVAAWGYNGNGQLGNDTTNSSFVPVAVNAASGVSALFDKTVVAIAAGYTHSLALCSDGTVAAWGSNDHGELGNNSTNSSLVPVPVNSAAGVSALYDKSVVGIAAGYTHNLALCSDGTLVAWGNNAEGELGDTTTTQRTVPVAVSTSSGISALAGKAVVAVAAGAFHSLALASDGTLAAWGGNSSGELGNNSTNNSSVPAAVNTAAGVSALFGKAVVAIATGAGDTLALCSDGSLTAWGWNHYGQLGDTTTTQRIVPTAVSTAAGISALYGKTVVAIAAGGYHSVALCSDGALTAWGFNGYGAVGDSTKTNRTAPVAVDMTQIGSAQRFTRAFVGVALHSLGVVAAPHGPDLNVTGNGLSITNGDLTPATADGTDFGGAMTPGGSVARTFVIQNRGGTPLNLTGTPPVTVTGPNAADFSVTQQPASLVAALTGTTTFQVTFAPSVSGTRTASLSIASDDADKNPYVFTVQGTGLKSPASVTLSNLSQTYDGTAKSVSASTVPPGLQVDLTYNGSPNAPTNAGGYTVIGVINDAAYQGSATNILVVGKATATLTLSSLSQTYDGTGKSASATTVPPGLGFVLTYNGSPNGPTNAGSYSVVGTISNLNYQGATTNTLVIGQAVATVTLGNLSQSYDGTPKNVSFTTLPPGLSVNVTYNGSANPPTAVASYTVVGTISELNWRGSTTNTLVIRPAAPVITWATPSAISYGTALTSNQLNAAASVPGTWAYNPAAGTVLDAGTRTLTAVLTPADLTNYSSVTGSVSLVVLPAAFSVTASNASRSYGITNPVFAGTITGVTNGDIITATYSCSAVPTSAPGQYAIIPSLVDPSNRLSNYSVLITNGILTVTCPTISLSPPGLPDAGAGVAYNRTLIASGGAAPYTFAVTGGVLPEGLTLGATNGVLSGVPGAEGTNAFTVTATDANGCQGSRPYILSVMGIGPGIASQPQSTTNVFASTATFTVSATGSPPLGYQWQFNGTNLVEGGRFSGVTTNRLSVANLQWADAGTNYVVVVTNAFGAITSAPASLTVSCPLIALTPTSLPNGRIGNAYSVALGATGGTGAYTFAVTAGALPAGLDLSSNGVVNGTPSLISTNGFTVMATDTNSGCTGTRSYALVILGLPPRITSQPQSLARVVGETATFSVAADGTPPFSYQWVRNGANLTGQTDSTLTLTNLLGANAGGYWAMVTNAYGSTNSTVATLTIIKVNPVLTWTAPAPIAYGTALSAAQLNASASVPGSFAYTPAAGTYLTVGTSALRAVFTPTDSASYNAATATVNIAVSPGSLTVTANNATRGYGQPNPVFTGTFTGMRVGDGISASYSCSATSNSPLGTYDIIPSLTDPNNRLTNYSVTVNKGILTIVGATPVITWATPAPIIYGTALGSSQLNATTTVGGSFAYSPTAGTVLSAGASALLAIFTPSDTTNYNSATGSVSLAIQRAPLSVTASNTTRNYQQPNPAFTGTLNGVTNNDNITANYTCSATLDSPAGTYPIVPELFDPGSRLGNYTVTYNNGTLTVNAVNDMFADRATILGVSNTIHSSNINATKEPGEPNHAGNVGGKSLWWTWTAPVSGVVTLDTVGSSFDTLLSVYTGNVVSNLVLEASDDESGGNHTSLLSFPAVAGTTYQIAVDGYAGAFGSIILNLREDYGVPTFTRQPVGTSVLVGSSVTFSASVRGSQPFLYQWRKDGLGLHAATQVGYPDFTNITFSIASALTNDSGIYSLFVSNSWGTVISSNAPLTVYVRPNNDVYSNAAPIVGVTNSVSGNNTYATVDGFEASSFAGRSVWWTWTAPTNGTVVADTIASSFDTVLAVYTNGPLGPVLMTWDDQSGGNNWSLVRFDTQPGITYYFGVDGSRWAAAGNTYGSIALSLKVLYLPPQITAQPQPQIVEPGWSVTFSATAIGTTPLSYQWVHDGMQIGGASGSSYAIASVQPSDAGNYSVTVVNAFGADTSSDVALTLYPVPANDAFANSIALPGVTNAAFGTNVGATKEPGEPNHVGNPGGRSVWWSWTSPTNGSVILDTVGSSFDTLLAVYTGNDVSTLSQVASDNNSGGNLASKLIFPATAGTTYHFAVDGYNPSGAHGAAFGSVALHFQQAPQFAPQITSQPQPQAIVAGSSVTFTVAALGLPGPTYQWLWNGVPLAGRTTATLQLSGVMTNQAGAYSCRLTNVAGALTSAVAMLRVEKPLNPGFRGNWPGFLTGEAEDVYVTNGLAYVATGAGLLVLDVGDPANPRRIGGYTSDSAATRIAFKDGFVYLLTSSNQFSGATLSRFDARNPALPRKVAEYVSSAASDFALAGDLICAVEGQSLLVLNTNCNRLATLTTGNGIARSVAASTNYAFVSWPNSIATYSLATPANPAWAGDLGPTAGELALWEGYLYAVTGGLRTVQLRVLDPGNATRPQVGSILTENALGVAEHQGLAVSTNAAYVVTAGYAGNALGVFDLTQPWNPSLIGVSLFADGTPRRLCVADDYVYVANGGAGLKVFDVYNPAHPTPAGQFFTAVEASAVALQGNLAYVLDVNTGFHVIDVTDPGNPFELGAYQSGRGAAAIAAKSQYVYVALDAPPTSITVSGPSLEIVDIANPELLRRVGSVTLPSPALVTLPQPGDPSVKVTALAVAANLVLVGSGLNGVAALGIVDVSNPAVPRVAGRFDLPGTAAIARIDFDGRYAYLADSNFGLRVLDLGDPANPVQVGSFAEPAATVSVSVRSNLCLVSGSFGTDVLDVSQPGSPVRVTTNSITGTVDWLQDPLALGFGPDGIRVFDMVNLASPLVIGQFVGDYNAVTVQGRYAFAAGHDAGLTILDLGAAFATPPGILDQPADCRTVAGGTASFFVAAKGNVPLTYQWRFNGSDIPGATDPLLTLSNVQLTQTGQYSVGISNALGFATSSNALLYVNLPPTVALASPNDQQVFAPPADIPLVATASDNDGYLAQVAFYQGTQLLGIITNWDSTNSEFSLDWTGVAAGTYLLSAVATDNEGATSATNSITIIVTNLPVMQFSRSQYTAYESNGVVTATILRSSADTTAATGVQTVNLTAQAASGSAFGNYIAVSNQVEFAVGQTSVDVPVQLVNDQVYRGRPAFRIMLSNPDAGWSLANPTAAIVSIVDDDSPSTTNSFTDVLPSGPPPADRGALTVVLTPPEASGQWRFAWETTWRSSGSTASNLPPGNYTTVFQEQVGWLAPQPNPATNVVGAGAAEVVTNLYVSYGGAAPGSLGVTISPSAIATNGLWRPVQNPPGPWLESGTTLTNLPPGLLVIEFLEVVGYSTPASRQVQVASDQTTLYNLTYLLAPAPASGESPRALVNLAAIANTNTPYQFSGQLLSDAGYSSGFVVKDRTVLTVAHALFDSATLTYANNIWWFLQREVGEYEPPPQVPRGSYVFAGYAAARTNDVLSGHIGPDESSTETRQLDVAALYFFEPAGRGGYGGYLTSDPLGTNWLLSSSLMLMIGYPVEGVPQADRGRMHQVGPGYFRFDQIPDTSLYSSTALQSHPGNSGGPLCVQAADSLGRPFFLPAGIFLGGSGETVVHSIDLNVVDLIKRSDISSHGGGNSTGGGVITLNFGTGSGTLAFIQVQITPAAAVSAGAAWRLQGSGTAWHSSSADTEAVAQGDHPVIEFRTVAGWDGPPSRTVTVAPGAQVNIINAAYTRSAQLVVSPAGGLGFSGAAGGPFSPATLTCTLTNAGQGSLSWVATNSGNWLTLSAGKGTLAGGGRTNITLSVNNNANSLGAGTYTNIIGFVNQSNGLGNTTRSVSLNVLPSHAPVLFYSPRVLTNGTFIVTLQGAANRVYSILSTTNLLQTLGSWTEVLRLTNVTGQTEVSLTNPPPSSSAPPRFYRAKEL
jgi:alpha-tubulin suppressor-like RCC1 family protein